MGGGLEQLSVSVKRDTEYFAALVLLGSAHVTPVMSYDTERYGTTLNF